MIIQHMSGNMLSRWTDFLTTDGEKEWRLRDEEFEVFINTKEEMMRIWGSGWQCLFGALKSLCPDQMQQTIFIRKEPHTVLEAISRQIEHYSYHVGQIVFIAKMQNDEFNSLSIPKNKQLGHSKLYKHGHAST